ncbi:MAG TPA: selenocysteine-specific translation elongation factor [Candidatus Binataceae bacterium]|nr:selenocysteine-specific translation elongation factor [Candidatus Binataceae bacterium]
MAAIAHAIIGTAGHIDHGKTALIRALTGQDTDRLKEEKERGISIDLGFAYFTLPDGTRAGIVDVPGHERFIRNMLAGAHGIDLMLLAVAADDGVMPQTEEHFDVLHLLGVQRGIFVITKADLAGRERIAEVSDEVRLLAEGTPLEKAPILAVSSPNQIGIEELRTEITTQLSGFQARRATGLFRLPVDRAFVMKGHGTVVTGTALGADVRVGQKLRVLPGGGEVRVRAIQVHGQPVERAELCQRVALNLAGAERINLERGLWLADERLDFATTRFDARLEIRPTARAAFANNTRVRLFIGAAEAMGRAIVLDASGEIRHGSIGMVQLVMREPVVALAGDRFVIRDETNRRTVGGGMVLNPLGRRNRKPVELYRERLATLADCIGADAIEALLNLQDAFAIPAARIAIGLNQPHAEVARALADSRFVKLSLGDLEGYTTREKWEQLKRSLSGALTAYHQAQPLAAGVEMEALRARLPFEIAARAFKAVIDRIARETDIVREDNTVRLRSHQVRLAGDDGTMAERICTELAQAGFHPPDVDQLARALSVPPGQEARVKTLLAALELQGRVVKISSELYFERSQLEAARGRLVDYLADHGEINAATYRDLLAASRKFSISLLDYFDHAGITTRVGDNRRLRKA